jgi:uncharacterized protein YjdB
MEKGTFYAVARVAKRELGSDFIGSGPTPAITNIAVDEAEDSITITGTNYNKVEWVADGKVIATGTAIDLDNYDDLISTYVRAQLEGAGGITFTQPFGVTRLGTEPVLVNGVTLNPTEVTVNKGDTTVITATISPADATNKNITWTSDNNAVATVNGGTITAVGAGIAVITATTEDGGFTANCVVTVVVPVMNVSLNKTDTAIIVGGTDQLTVTITPADATNQVVNWSSSNDTVASVDQTGLVTGVAAGSAVITVTTNDGGKTATCAVTIPEITAPIVTITSPTNGTSSVAGTSISFSGSALDVPDGDLSAGLSWTSSLDGPIGNGASFSKANLSVGTHTITASVTDSGGLNGSAQVTITVTEIPNTAPVVTITGPTEGTSYTAGTNINFSGSALDIPDGDLSAGLSWTSSIDGSIGSGAAFSEESLSVGTHTVIASVTDSEGHNGSAQVTITVTPPQSAYTFGPSADAKVVSSEPSTNHGMSLKLEQRVSTDTRRGYLKFDVSGLSGTVKSAKMRVYCTKTYSGGDSVYLVSNNYQGTTDPWTESGLNWNNAPSLPGTYLSKVAPVTANTWVEFNVTAAVTGNGVYSFALAHNATTLSYYSTKEAAENWPVLVIETLTSANTPPSVTISSPVNNAIYASGETISFNGSASDVPDGDLSAGLGWTSDLDGVLGSGASFSTDSLSVGTHTITASVTDSGSLSGSAQVTLTVTAISNTAPAVSITSPVDGNAYASGESISFNGSASDVPDGDLSAGLSWTSDLDGVLGSGASFSTDSLSVGTHTITASVTDSGSLSGSAEVTLTVTAIQSAYTFSPSADAKVVSSAPSTNYGKSTKLEQRVGSDTRRGYLKFDVSGLSGIIKSAKMRVYCLKTFSGGDSAYLVSNNYKGTTDPWTESGLKWNNAPSLPGTYLSKVASVSAYTWVEFDVTAAVTGNGVYSFALAHNASTLTYYSTKEAAQNQPVLVIEML